MRARRIIGRRKVPVNPITIFGYFDKFQVWFKTPLDRLTLNKLRKNCGKGGLYYENRNARWDWNYKQRVEFRQPNDWLVKWLSERDDEEVVINGLEVAVDFSFTSWIERDDAMEYFHKHLLRRWHGTGQEIRVYKENDRSAERVEIEEGESRYDAGRWAPNRVAMYVEEFSRATGELFCFHLEWRCNGLRPVRNAGIELPEHLMNFDHADFWEDRYLFADIDPKRIGAVLRKRKIADYGRERDRRVGGVILNSVGNMQDLFDEFGSNLRLGRIVTRLDHQHLLPQNGHGNLSNGNSGVSTWYITSKGIA